MGEERNYVLGMHTTDHCDLSNAKDLTVVTAATTKDTGGVHRNSDGTLEIPKYINCHDIFPSLFHMMNMDKPAPKLLDGVSIPAIVDYEVFNGRVMKLTFADGTFTKCVADSVEEFDFYAGLAFCLFKRLLGNDGHKQFNRLMRAAVKRVDAIIAEDIAKENEIERREQKRMKAELKRVKKLQKAKQEQIDIQSAAMLEALRKYGKEKG